MRSGENEAVYTGGVVAPTPRSRAGEKVGARR